jgi:hypothetical protein
VSHLGRAAIGEGLIYHNVGDKEPLVMACHRRSFRFRLREGIGERVASAISTLPAPSMDG